MRQTSVGRATSRRRKLCRLLLSKSLLFCYFLVVVKINFQLEYLTLQKQIEIVKDSRRDFKLIQNMKIAIGYITRWHFVLNVLFCLKVQLFHFIFIF